MPKEIERKFLLKNDNWKPQFTTRTIIKQGYLSTKKERTVRVRVLGEKGFLTIKGKTVGMTRLEFEYEIPVQEAKELLQLCEKPLIEKERFIVLMGKLKWEIDIFEGDNEGLELAEVELENEEQEVEIPEWIGEEVTFDNRYFNSSLVKLPFKNW
ncbi:MAG: CYTH domain-containing protein [Saprospiraceae bacterium]